METQHVKRAIILMPGVMTPFGKRAIDTLYERDKVIIEYFMESELMVNITEHMLVPKHTVFTILHLLLFLSLDLALLLL